MEELLPQWTEIDTDDALELLGPGTVDSRVRAFAVKQLSRAADDVCESFIFISSTLTSYLTGTIAIPATACASIKIRERS